jgi:hypothetical protein
VIVVRVIDLRSLLFGACGQSLIKMRMNDRRVIVIRAGTVCGVNVLKRREQES